MREGHRKRTDDLEGMMGSQGIDDDERDSECGQQTIQKRVFDLE